MEACRDCGKCCTNTEMELTLEDIERIEVHTKYSKNEFSYVDKDGFLVLQRKEDRCFFLTESPPYSCKIYAYRPQGCRFYPMMFDVAKQRCVLDEECPHRSDFYRKRKEFKHSCNKLKAWVKKHL